MTMAEYRQKQMAIKEEIASYRTDSCRHQAMIAQNEQQIVALNWKLTQLHHQFQEELEKEEGTL